MLAQPRMNVTATASRLAPPPGVTAGKKGPSSDVRSARSPDVGLYVGSFDPPRLGHIDVVQRSLSFVDQLVVSVATDNGKKSTSPLDERLELPSQCFNNDPHVSVSSYKGLTANHAISVGASILIRGLRSTDDMFVEHQNARANGTLAPGSITVSLMPNEQHILTFSTQIRQISALGGDVSRFAPPCVASKLSRASALIERSLPPGKEAAR